MGRPGTKTFKCVFALQDQRQAVELRSEECGASQVQNTALSFTNASREVFLCDPKTSPHRLEEKESTQLNSKKTQLKTSPRPSRNKRRTKEKQQIGPSLYNFTSAHFLFGIVELILSIIFATRGLACPPPDRLPLLAMSQSIFSPPTAARFDPFGAHAQARCVLFFHDCLCFCVLFFRQTCFLLFP